MQYIKMFYLSFIYFFVVHKKNYSSHHTYKLRNIPMGISLDISLVYAKAYLI